MSILRTRSQKMAATQALLNSRTGGGVGGAATTTPATAPPSGEWFAGYSKSKLWSILLAIAGVVVFFVGGLQHLDGNNPDPASIGSWGRNHWFSLLILWGIIALLIWLNAEKAAAKTLQWITAGVVVAVLVVFPLWGLATSPSASAPKGATATVCPNVSAEETRSCLATSEWSSWIQFANGSRDNGKHMCASLGVQPERKDENGVTFWRFRVAGDGTQDVKYRLFPADVDCSGNVL